MAVPDASAELDPEVAYWLEMAEAHAFHDTFAGAAEVEGDPAGARFATIGGARNQALLVLDAGFFNRTIGLGTAQRATREDVAAISMFYRDLGRQESVVHLAPGVQPADLVAWVGEEGYAPGRRWVKLWHDLDEIGEPPAALRIEAIGKSDRDVFADICGTAFELPPMVSPLIAGAVGRPGWTHYLGYEGDVPVSAGALFLVDGVAWLGYGSTLEAWRGRGWQTAMFLRRLQDARAAGCRLACTETGEEDGPDDVNHSYRNMLRTGFRLGYARQNYVRSIPSTN